jgi:hypothetical protein
MHCAHLFFEMMHCAHACTGLFTLSLQTLSKNLLLSLTEIFSLFQVSLTESQHSIANLTESPLSPSLSQDACSTSSSLSMMDCYSTIATGEQALLNDGGCMVQVRGAMARSAKTCYDGTASLL